MTESEIQTAQRKRYEAWRAGEGWHYEQPVHEETYMEPAQIERTRWLVENTRDMPIGLNGYKDILELGCSGGHQLVNMEGYAGLDVNPEVIVSNKHAYPDRFWICEDITKKKWFNELPEFDCVCIPDVLEHIEWEQVKEVIRDAKKIAKQRILLTVPSALDIKKNERNWSVMKHRWVCTESKFKKLLSACNGDGWQVMSEADEAFIYMRLEKIA